MAEQKKKKHKLKKKSVSIDFETDFYILGYDLSLSSPGFSCIHWNNGAVEIVAAARLNNKDAKLSRGNKLKNIKTAIENTIRTVEEKNFVCVRENSFSRFSAETQAISAVNGVFDLCLYENNIEEPILISPLTVKKLITGSSKATKQEVAEAIANYCTPVEFETDDVSDAVAVALAALIQNNYIKQIPLDKYKEAQDGV